MSSRDMYGGSQRSPRAAQSSRDVMLGPPKTSYASISQPPSARGSPIARNLSSPSQGRRMRPTGPYGVSRSSNSSPLTMATHDYYGDEPDLRVSHRSRSATRAAPPAMRSSYPGVGVVDQDFMPIRDRSLERGAADLGGGGRRGGYRGEDMYRETTIDGDPYRDYGGSSGRGGGGSFVAELQSRLNELQSQYGSVRRELDATTQKLGSSMHSIKTFWSPELKKERALRKEEAAKYALINDQLKILRSENQKQASLIRQLEEELRMAHMRNPDAELRQHLDALYAEKEHMAKEIFLLRETIKELELRIETQKQTLASRDESIRKLMEMLQSKGVGAFDSVLGFDKLVTGIVEPPFGAIASSVLNAGAGAASCCSIDRLLATLPHQTALTSALGRQQSGCPVQNANHGIFSTSALNDLSALLA